MDNDYSDTLKLEIAELLNKRGFDASGAKYWAQKMVAHGLKDADYQLSMLFYEVFTEAEINLHNRSVLNQVWANLPVK